MINYKQILEAVNRGIKFALDDFEDQEDIQGQINSKVNNKSNIKEYLEWNKCLDLLFKNVDTNYFNKMVKLSKIIGIQYKVNDIDTLKNIINWSCQICPNNDANLNWLDVSELTSMYGLFGNDYTKNFNGDISKWDVSNVEDMNYMFYKSNFNGNISKWDVSKVKHMNYMFSHSIFNGDISNWNVSKVETMIGMFKEVRPYDYPLDNWDVSNVKNMSDMFSDSWFNQPLNNWDVSGVENMAHMFSGSQYDQPLDKWDVSNVKNMDSMFSASHFRQNISNWNISKDCNTNNMWRLGMQYDINKPPKTRLRYRR